MTKLNDDSHQHGPGNQEGTHMRKALRATLILFPLLGITHLLFFINPKDGTHDKLYIIFNATMQSSQVKFIYSEKATKFCEIFTLLLTECTVVKSKVKISQNFVAFSEYVNFIETIW